MIYQFTAEHISRSTAVKLVREFEDKDIVVEHADMDPMFDNQMIMIVTCNDAVAKVIKNRIWEINNGAFCEMFQITADELEAYL